MGRNRVNMSGAAVQTFAALGKRLATGDATFAELQAEGIKKGTLSSALYAARVYSLVMAGLLREEEFDRLTFAECLAVSRALGDRSKKQLSPAAAVRILRLAPDVVQEFQSIFETGLTVAERSRTERPKGIYYDPERCAWLAYHKRHGVQVYDYFSVRDYGADGARTAAEVQRDRFLRMTFDELSEWRAKNLPVSDHERWLGEDVAELIADRVGRDPVEAARKGFEAGLVALRVVGEDRDPSFHRRNGKAVAA